MVDQNIQMSNYSYVDGLLTPMNIFPLTKDQNVLDINNLGLDQRLATMNTQVVSVKSPPIPFVGAKGNANFYNSGTGKYYQDNTFLIEATDDTQVIQALLNNGFLIFIPDGNFLIKGTLSTPDGVSFRMRGNGYTSRVVRGFNGGYMASVSGTQSQTKENCEVSNVFFDGASQNGFTGGGLDWSFVHFSYSENLNVRNCKNGSGINFTQTWDALFYKLTMLDCGDPTNHVGATVFQDTNYAGCDRIIFYGAHFENNLWSHVQGKNNGGHTNNKIDFIESKFHGATTGMPEYHTGWNVDMTNMFASHILGGEFGHGERHLYLDSTTQQCIISKPQLTYQDNLNTASVQINGSANDIDLFLGACSGINITGGQNKIKIFPVSITGNLILQNTLTTNDIDVFDNTGINKKVYGTDFWSQAKKQTAYKTANYTLTQMDDFISCNPSAPITITLPDVAKSSGKEFIIHNSSAIAITISPQNGQLINDGSSVVLSTAHTSARVISDGNKWYRINQ